jgi:hypothetical protein
LQTVNPIFSDPPNMEKFQGNQAVKGWLITSQGGELYGLSPGRQAPFFIVLPGC